MSTTTTRRRSTEAAILSIFITNLGRYNEGALVGEWVSLPADEDDLQAVYDRIGIDGLRYEEVFISDYESDIGLEVGEYENINDLNELAERLEALDSYDFDLVGALIGSEMFSAEEALKIVEDGDFSYYPGCRDMADVAEQYINETGMLDGVPDSIARYFDFEAFGRDMEYDGTWIEADDGFICVY